MTSSVSIQPTAVKTHAPGAPGQIVRTLLIVAALWMVSSQIYYALVDTLDLERGYDGAPILFTAYYLGWAALAFWLFRSLFAGVLDPGRLGREVVLMLPILLGFALFVLYVVPLMPQVSELRAPPNPPQFMFASAWYYLPKSADILFQQVLDAALIFASARAGLGLGAISIGMACAFGLFHLALALDGFIALYVARFTIAATVFGALLPLLYLRTRSGFRWAYALHWGFYTADATLTHYLLAAPPWVTA